jgi:hypothetical protein
MSIEPELPLLILTAIALLSVAELAKSSVVFGLNSEFRAVLGR